MSAIATFRTAIAKLLDDSTNARYSNDQIDQALRQALQEYSRVRPYLQTYNVNGTGERVLEMPADFQPIRISRVDYHDENDSPQVELAFYSYHQDGSWFIELADQVLAATESIDVSYLSSHQIDGLDSAAGTSVPAEDENAVQQGAAGYAALYRAVSRAESVNLQPAVQKQLLELSQAFLRAFRAAIAKRAGSAFAVLPAIPTDTF